MKSVLFFLIFFIVQVSFAQVNQLEKCGGEGSKEDRITDCSIKNPNFKIQHFTLVTSNSVGKFLMDNKTKLVWSPEFRKRKGFRRCKKPYKKARRRHYKKVTNRQFKKKKKHFRCISKLNDYLLIPDNRYLYFKK